MTAIPRSVQSLVDHLQQAGGVDTQQTQLVATVALLPAGERDHYSGIRVKAFQPVALRLDFVDSGTKGTYACASFEGAEAKMNAKAPSLLDVDFFNAHVHLHGALEAKAELVDAAGSLMRELVSKHREITGVISAAYEHIEVDPQTIQQITGKRFQLEIGLERLAKFLALDEEWFDLLCECTTPHAQARMKQIGFEKLMLKSQFIKQPCSQDLYDGLSREFLANNFCTGMEFVDYYAWFRRSEGFFDTEGKLVGETRSLMQATIAAWYVNQGDKNDFRQFASYWANRNYEIHPRHREAVELFINEVVERLIANQAKGMPGAAQPRGSTTSLEGTCCPPGSMLSTTARGVA